jgi:hypothetical protein
LRWEAWAEVIAVGSAIGVTVPGALAMAFEAGSCATESTLQANHNVHKSPKRWLMIFTLIFYARARGIRIFYSAGKRQCCRVALSV